VCCARGADGGRLLLNYVSFRVFGWADLALVRAWALMSFMLWIGFRGLVLNELYALDRV
jgi:hypothetical protein